MRIRWFCHWGKLTGYGRAARDYLAALSSIEGVELEIGSLGDAGCKSPEPRYQYLDKFVVPWDRVKGTVDVEVYHAIPRVLAALEPVTRDRGKRVALTTWETSSMPMPLLEPLTKFDAVITPSEFCCDAIGGAGLVPYSAIRLIPHCFDEDFWPDPVPDERTDRPYRFYSLGAWGERKNTLGLLRAYLHGFSKEDNVSLVLMIDNANFDELRSTIARSGLAPAEMPQLVVPDHILEEEELVALHAESDCFVTATRGEGFGLGMFEAAIMGRHVIAPLCGGQSDFLDDYAFARAVPFQATPCWGGENRARIEEQDGKRYQVSTVDLPPGINCRQSWADPDLSMLAAQMRALYDARNNLRTDQELADARRAFEERFGYDAIGPLLAITLREIAK